MARAPVPIPFPLVVHGAATDWESDDDVEAYDLPPPTFEELFDIMDEAQTAQTAQTTQTAQTAQTAQTTQIALPSPAQAALSPEERVHSDDPNVHVCVGLRCPFIEMNCDRTYVCSVVGICWAQQGINDPFTAGIISSLDENGVRTCGVDPRSASRRRRDPRLASEQAMIVAHDLERAEQAEAKAEAVRANAIMSTAKDHDALALVMATPPPRSEALGGPGGSGALALAHTPEARSTAPRRRRPLNTDQLAALRRDAQDTLDKLTSPRMRPVSAKAKAATGASGPPATSTSHPPPAPPLPSPAIDARASLEEELRAHVRRCQIAGRVPLLDDLHNIELNARHAVNAARQSASGRASATQRGATHGQLRTLGATLVVALWGCVLRSPYMAHAKRASDNFRPFAAGVFFSMRRGVALGDGGDTALMLVPRCGALADALPVVRAAHRGTPTHAVHLSHHRGVRTLLKCIASVPTDEAVDFFSDALRVARTLEEAMGAGGGGGGR